MHKGERLVAVHHGMPFGATASVVAWHKLGGLLQKIARVMLHAPVYRYVDDYFACERSGHGVLFSFVHVSVGKFACPGNPP